MNIFSRILLWGVCSLLLCTNTYAQSSNNNKQIRLMSYNVRNGIGVDGTTSFQGIADVITKVTPDVVAVQELDSATVRSKKRIVLNELALRTAMYPSFSSAIHFQGGGYGVGILSKEKPLHTESFALPGKEEQRTALIAEFKEYVFCCTHFSLTEQDRMKSITLLTNRLQTYEKPVYFGGDLNALPESSVIAELQNNFYIFNDVKKETYPSSGADRCIDYIGALKQKGTKFTVTHKKVLDGEGASDHLPLYVDVVLHAKKETIFRTKPFIQDLVESSLSISWFTNVKTHSWIEYGPTKDLGNKAESLVGGQVVSNNKHHKIKIKDLVAGQTYFYKAFSKEIVVYGAYNKEFGETAESKLYSFTVPDKKEENFTAVVFNDLHKKKETLTDLLANLEGVNFDLVFFNGDCIDDPRSEADALNFLSFCNEKVDASQRPVFYMRGNHEIRNAWSVELNKVIDCIGETTYGAFSWGDSRFVLLDCGEDKPDSHWVYYNLNHFEEFRLEQSTFLKNELTSKSFKRAKKKILLHHIPIYGMDNTKYLPCYEMWNPILQNAPFTVDLAGHTHSFAYHEPTKDKIPFPVVIGGGYKKEAATVTILTKVKDRLTVSVKNTNGEELLHLDL